MKYLHLSEHFVINELPFAKGLQYQASVISMEGGDFRYIGSAKDIQINMEKYNNILNPDEDVFGE